MHGPQSTVFGLCSAQLSALYCSAVSPIEERAVFCAKRVAAFCAQCSV